MRRRMMMLRMMMRTMRMMRRMMMRMIDIRFQRFHHSMNMHGQCMGSQYRPSTGEISLVRYAS